MSSLLEKLESNVSQETVTAHKNELDKLIKRFEDISNDTEEDYAFARKKIKALIDRAEEAIETMADLASQSEHPRAFEVLNAMIIHTSQMIERLLDLQKKRKLIHLPTNEQRTLELSQEGEKRKIVFSGTTKELTNIIREAHS